VMPRNAALQTPGGNAPHLEYQMYLLDEGDRSVEVWTYLSPRNSVRIASGDQDGLLFAVSIDGEAPQVINATQRLAINPQANSGNGNKPWEWKSADNIIRIPTTHQVSGPNPHVLKYWVVDPMLDIVRIYRREGRDAQRFTNIYELIPQTFVLPVADFAAAASTFDPRQVATIRLVFDKTEAGTVVVQHVGVSTPADPAFLAAPVPANGTSGVPAAIRR